MAAAHNLSEIANVVPISTARVARLTKACVWSLGGFRSTEEKELFVDAANRLPNNVFAKISDTDIVRGLLASIRKEF